MQVLISRRSGCAVQPDVGNLPSLRTLFSPVSRPSEGLDRRSPIYATNRL